MAGLLRTCMTLGEIIAGGVFPLGAALAGGDHESHRMLAPV
jgi:hypothetical protein